jgi:hypothetical protein
MRQIILVLVTISFGSIALAEAPEKIMGWSKNGNLGLNLSFSSSQDVVGQTDGTSQSYGLNLKAGMNRTSSSDEWRNTFTYLGSTTKTPSVPRFLKSNDELKLGTIYLYSLPAHPDVGPYVSGEAAAPVFNGEDVRGTPQAYRIIHHSGPPDSTFTGTSVHLTDGFKPLTTKEGAGFFWKAVQDENLKLELRLGLGAMQVNADGQLAVTGTNKAGEVEITELQNGSHAGVTAGLGLKGKVDEKSTFDVGAEALTPFVTNKEASDQRDNLSLTDLDAFVKLTSNVTSWASFGYDYKLKIQPQLVNRAQQIHLLVLNINYNLF